MNTSTDPLVSVYIPTHKRPEMALRAVRSVLAQDYPAIQIIVCDDGTPFEQTEALREELKENSAIYLRNEAPQGACFSRNRAIDQASGVFITGLDDDDEFTPGRISSLFAAYEKKYAYVAASYLEISAAGQAERRFDHGSISFDGLLHYNKVGNQVFTETSRIRDLGGFDTQLPAMQDYDMWLRLSKHHGQAVKLPECSYLLHTEHESERISSQAHKLLEALNMLESKFSTDYKNRHRRSTRILKKAIQQEHVPFFEALAALHPDNYRFVLTKYLRQAR